MATENVQIVLDRDFYIVSEWRAQGKTSGRFHGVLFAEHPGGTFWSGFMDANAIPEALRGVGREVIAHRPEHKAEPTVKPPSTDPSGQSGSTVEPSPQPEEPTKPASPGKSGDAPGQTKEPQQPATPSDPGKSGDAPGQEKKATTDPTADPGNSGDAPGQTGDAGKSADAPGQTKSKTKGKSADAPGQTKKA